MSQEPPKAALQQALRSAWPEIHRSGQGVQYAADGYTELLRAASVQISMSAQGQPTGNAYAERFMRTLKEEEVYLHAYQDFAEEAASERPAQYLRLLRPLPRLSPPNRTRLWRKRLVEI